MILLLLWLACGIACSVIASAKGRSGFGWLILGCLFPIALIVIAVLPARNPETLSKRHTDQLVWDGKLKRCPDCAEAVQTDARVCKHCGFRFNETVA